MAPKQSCNISGERPNEKVPSTIKIKSVPLPDKDKEQELSRLQVGVQEIYLRGNYRQALERAKELLTETEAHFSEDHPATASAYCNVGLINKQLGHYDDAHRAYKTATRIYKKVLGTKHASYAACLHNTAVLYQSQVHLDASLKATDRWTLLEEAQGMLEDALQIRRAELGEHHPHVVATQSSLGSILLARILHYTKVIEKKGENQQQSQATRLYTRLVLNEDISNDTWEAAEAYSRGALETAIRNPRGPQRPKGRKGKNKPKVFDGSVQQLDTLSSANAAQNLAIFLKARAVVVQEKTNYSQMWLQEAHDWYREVLAIRKALLPEGHALIYATMYSLAECLESMDRTDDAQLLRQEIVDIYDPPAPEKGNLKGGGVIAPNAE